MTADGCLIPPFGPGADTGKLTQVSDAVAMDAKTAAEDVPGGAEGADQGPELLAEIRSSFALIEAHAPQASAWFYEHFFAQNPRYRKLFTGDPAAQQRRLFQAVARVIADFDDLDDFLPYLQRLALRHRKFGLRPAHYQAFGDSMLATIERFTGPAWTDLTRQAWDTGFGLVASVMLESAAEAEAEAPPHWEAEVIAHELLAEDVARIEVRGPAGTRTGQGPTGTTPGSSPRWSWPGSRASGATSPSPAWTPARTASPSTSRPAAPGE